MRRKTRREIETVNMNINCSLDTARAGLEQLRDGKPIDREEAATCLERLIYAVERQNERLSALLRHPFRNR